MSGITSRTVPIDEPGTTTEIGGNVPVSAPVLIPESSLHPSLHAGLHPGQFPAPTGAGDRIR